MKTRRYITMLLVVAGLAFTIGNRSESLDFPSIFGKKSDEQRVKPVPVAPSVLNLQDSFAEVANRIKPAVVNITAAHVESYGEQPYEFYFGDPFEEFFERFFEQPAPRHPRPRRKLERRMEGTGSGVIVDAQGYILTNAHVVAGAEDIQVRLAGEDEKVYKGKVIGTDSRSDLAVIKIKAKNDLPFATLADSDKVRVGDWAIAVGSPFGLEQTVTVGVVSALRQSLSIEGNTYANLLQTDAAINRGNSGGPLVNISGEVIGINTAIYAPTGVFAGVGFAIPSNPAKEIMDQLIAKGHVVRGWLGVEIAGLDQVTARQFGVPDKNGVLINRVLPDSPAAKAGIRRGDILREFDGQKITTPESLQATVGKTPPEKKVKLVLWRDGKETNVSLTTGKMPDKPDQEGSTPDSEEREETGTAFDWEGADVRNLSATLSSRLQLPSDVKGVVITDIKAGSAAESFGLASGDVIASVNRRPTPDLDTFKKVVKGIDMKEGFLLDVFRRGSWIYITYKGAE